MSFERDLRRALERTSPPSGFAERVAARLHGEDTSETPSRRPSASGRRKVVGALAAALIVSTIGSAGYLHWQRERDGERARGQLIAALKVSSNQLTRIGQRLAVQDRDEAGRAEPPGER